ncbi:sulfoxide reductase heme-binding subunit YedZ, partial [Rhizobium ruizarguesonis]
NIMFGMAGLALLSPLAVTSNNLTIRRLGKNWIWLHRLVYINAACGALHFALSTKILDLQQYIYVGLIIALILYRSYRAIARYRQKGKGRTRYRAVASVS